MPVVALEPEDPELEDPELEDPALEDPELVEEVDGAVVAVLDELLGVEELDALGEDPLVALAAVQAAPIAFASAVSLATLNDPEAAALRSRTKLAVADSTEDDPEAAASVWSWAETVAIWLASALGFVAACGRTFWIVASVALSCVQEVATLALAALVDAVRKKTAVPSAIAVPRVLRRILRIRCLLVPDGRTASGRPGGRLGRPDSPPAACPPPHAISCDLSLRSRRARAVRWATGRR